MNEENKPNNPFAYLDNNEEVNPSQEGEEKNTPDESPEEDLHKQPRFQKVIKNWRETEKKLAEVMEHSDQNFQKVKELEDKLTEYQQGISKKEAPEYWAKLYETKEQADAAWSTMQTYSEQQKESMMKEIEVLAEKKAREILSSNTEESSKWEKYIDSELQKLEEMNPDIDITSNSPQAKKLRQGIQKIWTEYSPKNEKGEYVFIPIEKAYDLLQKEEKLSKAPVQNARKQAASLSMARSSTGEQQFQTRVIQPTPRKPGFKSLPWRARIAQDE